MNPALPKSIIFVHNIMEGMGVVAGFMEKHFFKEGRAG